MNIVATIAIRRNMGPGNVKQLGVKINLIAAIYFVRFANRTGRFCIGGLIYPNETRCVLGVVAYSWPIPGWQNVVQTTAFAAIILKEPRQNGGKEMEKKKATRFVLVAGLSLIRGVREKKRAAIFVAKRCRVALANRCAGIVAGASGLVLLI